MKIFGKLIPLFILLFSLHTFSQEEKKNGGLNEIKWAKKNNGVVMALECLPCILYYGESLKFTVVISVESRIATTSILGELDFELKNDAGFLMQIEPDDHGLIGFYQGTQIRYFITLRPKDGESKNQYLPPGKYRLKAYINTNHLEKEGHVTACSQELPFSVELLNPHSITDIDEDTLVELATHFQKRHDNRDYTNDPPAPHPFIQKRISLIREVARLSPKSMNHFKLLIGDEWECVEPLLLLEGPLARDEYSRDENSLISDLTSDDWRRCLIATRCISNTSNEIIISTLIKNLSHPYAIFPSHYLYPTWDPYPIRPVSEASFSALRFLGRPTLDFLVKALPESSEWQKGCIIRLIILINKGSSDLPPGIL